MGDSPPRDSRPVLHIGPSDVEELRRAIGKATAEGLDQFQFQGHPLLLSYARYLLEYLEFRFRM